MLVVKTQWGQGLTRCSAKTHNNTTSTIHPYQYPRHRRHQPISYRNSTHRQISNSTHPGSHQHLQHPHQTVGSATPTMADSTALQARVDELELSYADTQTRLGKHKRAFTRYELETRKKARIRHELNQEHREFLEAQIAQLQREAHQQASATRRQQSQ